MHRRCLLLAAAVFLPVGCAANDTGSSQGPAPTATGTTPTPDASDMVPPLVDGSVPVLPDASQPAVDAGADSAGSGAVAVPFFVSDAFVPSGFMGDSQASMAAITMAHDAASCKTPRQAGAGGDCYSITWAPSPPDGGSAWAGVYWQSPSNNWGAKEGKSIAAGATKVTFYAAGAAGGETIQACAGGINSNGPMPTLPYGDTFSVKSQPIVLTTTWAQYEVSLQGATYSSVLGGFCWVGSASAPVSETFYVDDVRWQ